MIAYIQKWLVAKGGVAHVVAVAYVFTIAAYAGVPNFAHALNMVYAQLPAWAHASEGSSAISYTFSAPAWGSTMLLLSQ